MFHRFTTKYGNYFFIVFLFLILILYYQYFINKGLVFSDEGVYTYTAELIMQGKIPYREFFLQYPPLYFYILGLIYKIIGPSIIAGRLLSFIFCIGIFAATLGVLRSYSLTTKKSQIIALLCIASFGYPLINIPLLTWPTVLLTALMMIVMIHIQKTPSAKNIIFLGILFGILFATKQNIALTQIILANSILLFTLPTTFFKRVLLLIKLNLFWICLTMLWIYYFFFPDNSVAIIEFFHFSARLSTIYPFSYPPLTMLFEPLGLLKLIPYYLPILFLFLLIIHVIKKSKEVKMFILFLPLNGFFTTIYPVSELLHVYPYFGLVLISFYIYYKLYMKKYQILFYSFLFIAILLGFYLSLFREHYRYHSPYRDQQYQLNLPKSQGLLVDKANNESITEVYKYLKKHTKDNDYIFAYPFSPMQYFIFERKNPSRYPIYQQGYLTTDEEKSTITAIRKTKTKYIIIDGNYELPTQYNTVVDKSLAGVKIGQFTIYHVKKD